MEEFSERLKRIREEKKLTQKQVADLLNVSRSAISAWESGERRPRKDKYARIIEVFGPQMIEVLDIENIVMEQKKETFMRSNTYSPTDTKEFLVLSSLCALEIVRILSAALQMRFFLDRRLIALSILRSLTILFLSVLRMYGITHRKESRIRYGLSAVQILCQMFMLILSGSVTTVAESVILVVSLLCLLLAIHNAVHKKYGKRDQLLLFLLLILYSISESSLLRMAGGLPFMKTTEFIRLISWIVVICVIYLLK